MQSSIKKRSYELNFHKLPDYLLASIHCPVSGRDVISSYMSEIIDECQTERCRKLMIEIDRVDFSWIWEAAFINFQFPLSGLEETKVAIVDHSPEKSDLESFGVNFGRGHKMDIRVFKEKKVAKNWLAGEPKASAQKAHLSQNRESGL